MLAYAGMLATLAGLLAVGLHWLQKPYVIPNKGVAAYRPAIEMTPPLTISTDTAIAMERSARLAAGMPAEREANAEPKTERTAQSNTRQPPTVASRPVTDQRRPQGFWAQNPFQSLGRWF
jgi:hypothetical protein